MSLHYVVKTLGCKANLYDSQLIEAELQKRGWSPLPSDEADAGQVSLCIVNSCTVTDEADRQSRKLASKLARDNPSARVVLTGCAAEVDPERMAGTQGVHYVIGNRDKPEMVGMILKALERAPLQSDRGEVLGVAEGYSEMASRHPMDREWPIAEDSLFLPAATVAGDTSRTRAFLKIQDGCNSFCTYCIIPYGRGPSRSLTIPEVIRQVSTLVGQGIREVVITGINIGDYGTDWSDRPQITPLLEAILRETSLERLRVSSLDPVEIEPSLLALMEREPRLCPHFHVSLQSPHSRVLKLMKRKYSTEQVVECLEKIARIPAPPGGCYVGMDVITGFPGETLQEFEWGLELLSRLPWTRLHVFPFSERAGTPATRLSGAVPQQERMRRAKILREMSLERQRKIHAAVLQGGASLENVLMERPTAGPDGSGLWVPGHATNYLKVLVRANEREGVTAISLFNQLLKVQPRDLLCNEASGEVMLLADSL